MRVAAFLALALIAPVALAASPLDDDAGSGQDAPNTAAQGGLPIASGIVYNGSFGLPSDTADHYAFSASAGDLLEASMWPPSACIAFYTPSAHLHTSRCSIGTSPPVVRITANVSGTWILGISQPFRALTPYQFSLGVDEATPDPTPPGVPSLATAKFIQPGEQVSTPHGSCTLNFVYNGTGAKAGRVFIGTAAHCFRGLGEVASMAAFGALGRVVYMGDYSGLNVPTFNNGIPGAQQDFALIEVDPALHDRVKGEVKGHPGQPTAVKSRLTVAPGHVFKFSGYGTGFGLTKPTREMRVGVYTFGGSAGWNAAGPIAPGDSGGPVLHSDGQAIGIATHVSAYGAGGHWVEVAIAEASANGWPIALRPAY